VRGSAARALLIALIAAASSAVVAFGDSATPTALIPNPSAAESQGLAPARAVSASTPDSYRSGVVLVGFHSGISTATRYAIERAAGGEGATHLGPAIAPAARGTVAATQAQYLSPLKLRVRPGDVLAVARALRRNPAVAYAEPDYLMSASATPNDPSFSLQWGDGNTGQLIPTQESEELLGPEAKGTPGADDRALAAWGVTTGSRSIVIGETDTGVDYNHPDLAANIWSNPGGIGGCASATHGYNVRTHTCEPMDDDTVYGGHGTHVAGIMGAVGNNGVGVAGMNWQTSILPVKWLSSSASGETSGLIEALQWLVAAKQAGVNVRVVNDSATFVGTAFSQALSNEIDTLGANNILFVTAAGNTGNNNDEEKVRRYPCGYDRPTELCVTATDNNDHLPKWANYGPHTVDLAAPGVSIYSTLRKGAYGYLSGGSMASPQVAGAAALILSAKPSLSAVELKADITANVDPLPALSGKVISGGRLDVCKALPGCSTQQQPPPTATFGKTTVGASSDSGIFSGYKVVHAATMPTAGSVTKLSLYAIPGVNSPSPQALRAVIYGDSGGSPGTLLATGPEVVYQGSVNGSGWFELPLTTPLALSPGTYWLGFITGTTTEGLGYRYDTVANSRAYNTNPFAGGPTNPFGAATKDSEQASIYATYTTTSTPQLLPPVNTSPPTISGTAQVGQTLRAGPGSWSESPSGYAYQWQHCDSTGANCSAIAGATAQTFALSSADLNRTIRVVVVASNSAGSSPAASSSQTALVTQAEQSPATLGKTSVGFSSDTFSANRKRVNRYALSSNASVTKLSIYLTSAASSGSQTLQGIVYSDSSGKPAALLGSTETLTFKAKSASGWYDLKFSSPLKLAAGNYWIGAITGATSAVAGFRYDNVSGSRDYNSNTFTSGPTNPFGAVTVDGEQESLYATYLPG
jgi:subtilisin family serine protease